MTKIKFSVKEFEKWNVLLFELENVLTPRDLQSVNPPKLPGTKGVILSGRGPIWLYSYCRYAVNFSDPSIRLDLQGVLGSPSSEVRELIKTLGMPYVPGTSIKGAIRTAILWWALKTNKRLMSEVESLLRNQKGNSKFADNERVRLREVK